MRKLQKEIIGEMKVQEEIVPGEEFSKRVEFVKDYMKAHPFLKSIVLGISGGQDSTLAGKIFQMAVDQLNSEEEGEYEFIAVRLPYGTQKDESDCEDALTFIEPDRLVTVDIKPAVDKTVESVEHGTGCEMSDFLKGNTKARERMKVQYDAAGMFSGIVGGTDHGAEAVTGFFTKFGDGAADILPLFGLNKRQGRELLKSIECPEHLYNKVPSADLEEDKPQLADEEALGVSYEAIDDYLEGREIVSSDKLTIESWYRKTEHKRQDPVTLFDEWWKS